ncbi:AIR synthase related protein [Domibacillus tundrae]|uniref:AIR synthase related protein n=1 Tax=Domibacillus tundrae TaxID=1587527 RepID=UPI000617BBB3|nr:AIR synthase related protein [Domibacillus tundrae]
MRDVIRTNGLIIAADNSGSIGEKEQDAVQAPYEVVGYFSARVALMECIAAGGEPFAVVLQNFSGEAAWKSLYKGIQKAAAELGCELELTGSTESNFTMQQSASGVVVIGRHVRDTDRIEQGRAKFGIVGKPLVGSEVMAHPNDIAPLSVFRQIAHMNGVYAVLPVGSKGIAYELMQLTGRSGHCELDMTKSAGPSTCFIAAVNEEVYKQIEEVTDQLYWLKMHE